jgi:hypothetical protein
MSAASSTQTNAEITTFENVDLTNESLGSSF